ncbi:MAG: radical SAM protein [Pseudanabaenaceae cyanobacterium SKYGB_i_bin29]|nr:B12-binding domain-containing radical SAM protein [Pseudanabaenaceae cyanobacterium SKYG29]MDW8420843.1 radical SAM protein [Pseudanabaenaceae cyanobacterium SKYGB_i_bin29]
MSKKSGKFSQREHNSLATAKQRKTLSDYAKDEILLFEPAVRESHRAAVRESHRAAVRESHRATVPSPDSLAIVYAFPNTYSVGITSLGYQMIWASLATRSDVAVYRWFTDVADPLPPAIDLWGFSFSWELDFVHILSALKQLGIPWHSQDRDISCPLVFGGGAVLTANPEPYASWFDFILLGDGEELIPEMIAAFKEVRGASRQAKLERLAQVPGIYVPQGYQVDYHDRQGKLKSITPLSSAFPPTVTKRSYRGNVLSASTVVTPHSAWENIYMVEVVRSCPEMCRFCLASYLTLPFRVASVEGSLLPAIERGFAVTNRIGLLGASITQHPEFEQVLDYIDQPQFADLRLSLASVRTNTLTVRLCEILSRHDSRSVTIAIESGSERLRQIINKKLSNEEIKQAVANAQAGGLKGIKFYGMVGVPGEDMADLEATIGLLRELKKIAPQLKLTLGCSTFVPKAHTPWQWCGIDRQGDKKLQYLQKHLAPQGIDLRPESYKDSLIQGLLSRGDRRLTPLLELVWQYSQGDVPSDGMYKRAYKDLQAQLPPLDYYLHDRWQETDILPWQHLRTALSPEQLQRHYHQSQSLVS